MKYITVYFHYVRNHVQQGLVNVVHIHGADKLADTLIKALTHSAFDLHLVKLDVLEDSLS